MVGVLIYVDSNYWIYWLDSRLPEHKPASEVMRKMVNGVILMNYVTLVEIGHYLRTLPHAEFAPKVEMILNLSTLRLIALDDAIARSAMDLLPRYSSKGLGGRDCVIIATMQAHGLKEVLTHDVAFTRIDGVRVIDVLAKN